MSKQIETGNVSNVQIFDIDNVNNTSDIQYFGGNEHENCPRPQPSCVDVDSRNLGDCPNVPEKPIGITTGVVAKIPVVLAQLRVRFHVRSIINLPEPALEIKDIKKRLKITQCLLLQPTNVLFIKGFVRKNIDYSTRTCSNFEGVCGEIHHCTVDIPFECTTPVTFFREPAPLLTNCKQEFEFLKEEELPRDEFAEKDKLMSGDLSEFNQVSEEFFNEPPFCELLSSGIVEFDEFINRRRPSDIDLPFEERLFRRIEEKMLIELTFKILQNRQVTIPRTFKTGAEY